MLPPPKILKPPFGKPRPPRFGPQKQPAGLGENFKKILPTPKNLSRGGPGFPQPKKPSYSMTKKDKGFLIFPKKFPMFLKGRPPLSQFSRLSRFKIKTLLSPPTPPFPHPLQTQTLKNRAPKALSKKTRPPGHKKIF